MNSTLCWDNQSSRRHLITLILHRHPAADSAHCSGVSASTWTRKQNVSFRSSHFYYRLEEMADMDELFGSDGDSDNEQRGNVVALPLKVWFV